MTIIHEPSRPVRADVIGEVVFMSNWHDLTRRTVLNGDSQVSFLRHLLKPIIYTARDVTQCEAMVAASFIKWLGTGCGSCFLSEMLKARNNAPLLGEQKACGEYWAKENVIDPVLDIASYKISLQKQMIMYLAPFRGFLMLAGMSVILLVMLM